MVRCYCPLLVLARLTASQTDQTSVTDDLNQQIAEGTCGVFCGGGKGIMIRNPYDGYETGGSLKLVVVPATFWHNDIVTGNKIFPSSGGSSTTFDWGVTSYNVDCPNNGDNGFFKIGPECKVDPGTGNNSPWRYANMGYIIGDMMGAIMMDFDNIQNDDWGWGVFYPTDSNSVDFRCRYLGDWDGYDCPRDPADPPNWPGGWIDSKGKWSKDDSKLGPGVFPAGNPFADPSWGGGTGCHYDKRGHKQIDQNDAIDANGDNLMRNKDCECNYGFKNDWNEWVDHWIEYSKPKKGLEDENWLGGGKLAPNRALDQVSCWVNNLKDMIQIQNAIWYKRFWWANQKAPATQWDRNDPNTQWAYWGWNEIPMTLNDLKNTDNHQAIMIKIPTSLCGNGGGDDVLDCLGHGQQQALENDIDNWVNGPDQFGYLVPGMNNAGNRPGSYVVLAREWYDNPADRWRIWFFCQDWTSPQGKYRITFIPMQNGDSGACVVEKGHSYHKYYGNATNVGELRHKYLPEFATETHAALV